MKNRTHGRKTIRNRSAVGAGQLTVNTGMTLWEFRQRSGRRHNGKAPTMPCLQCYGARGLNTSGALAGLRASSFPNPPMGPPRNQTCADCRTRSTFGSLTAGAACRLITKDSNKVFRQRVKERPWASRLLSTRVKSLLLALKPYERTHTLLTSG